MTGLTFEFDDADLQKMLTGTGKRIRDPRPAIARAGDILRESIRTNFAVGGRPAKWRKLKRRQGQPLRDTGQLQNSIASRVVTDRLVEVGTNKVYAAVQNFGAPKGSFGIMLVQVKASQRVSRKGNKFTVRAHSRMQSMPFGTIPAREYMLVQDEDKVEIRRVLADYIVEDKRP